MATDVSTIITSIKDIASGILEKDISTVRGFSERQVEAIAKQTVIIQKGIANGDIDEDLREFFFRWVGSYGAQLCKYIERNFDGYAGKALECPGKLSL